MSVAALISAMNRQLFMFVQQNPGLFMTVYHEGNLAKSSLPLLGVTNKLVAMGQTIVPKEKRHWFFLLLGEPR